MAVKLVLHLAASSDAMLDSAQADLWVDLTAVCWAVTTVDLPAVTMAGLWDLLMAAPRAASSADSSVAQLV